MTSDRRLTTEDGKDDVSSVPRRPPSVVCPLSSVVCRLVCVDPAWVHELWPHVRDLIQAAMRRGDLSAFRPVERSVLRGDALLWIAWTGDEVAAAAITEPQQTEWRKVCVIVACGGAGARPPLSRGRPGTGMRAWLALLDGIEAYARVGRKGWARVLTSYKAKRIVLEKDL